MKKTVHSLLIIGTILCTALLGSCDPSGDINDQGFTNEEVAFLLAESITSENGLYFLLGELTDIIDSQTGVAKSGPSRYASSEICGVEQNESEPLDFSSPELTTTGQLTLRYTFNCVEETPTTLTAAVDLNATFEGTDFSSTLGYDLDYLIGNFPGNQPFTIGGTLEYDTEISSGGENSIFGYSWDLSDGLLDKQTGVLTGGTGTIDMTISGASGQPLDLPVPFNIESNGNITVVINGQQFSINPFTGLST